MSVDITNHPIPWSQVQKMLAHAWDEGYEVGWERGHYEVETEANPYRTVKDN